MALKLTVYRLGRDNRRLFEPEDDIRHRRGLLLCMPHQLLRRDSCWCWCRRVLLLLYSRAYLFLIIIHSLLPDYGEAKRRACIFVCVFNHTSLISTYFYEKSNMESVVLHKVMFYKIFITVFHRDGASNLRAIKDLLIIQIATNYDVGCKIFVFISMCNFIYFSINTFSVPT